MAISAEAYERMQKEKNKEEAECSDSDKELLCFTAEVKVWNISGDGSNISICNVPCQCQAGQPAGAGAGQAGVSLCPVPESERPILCCLLLFWLAAM